MLLTDAKLFEHLLVGDRRRATEWMDSMRGVRYGKHPDSLATHIQQTFDGNILKPLATDVCQILRDHAGMMFHCMYSLLAPRGRINANFVAEEILSRFNLWHHTT